MIKIYLLNNLNTENQLVNLKTTILLWFILGLTAKTTCKCGIQKQLYCYGLSLLLGFSSGMRIGFKNNYIVMVYLYLYNHYLMPKSTKTTILLWFIFISIIHY